MLKECFSDDQKAASENVLRKVEEHEEEGKSIESHFMEEKKRLIESHNTRLVEIEIQSGERVDQIKKRYKEERDALLEEHAGQLKEVELKMARMIEKELTDGKSANYCHTYNYYLPYIHTYIHT